MGIKSLTKLISEVAPGIIRESELKELTGRRVAIDASMAIYQFLVRRAERIARAAFRGASRPSLSVSGPLSMIYWMKYACYLVYAHDQAVKTPSAHERAAVRPTWDFPRASRSLTSSQLPRLCSLCIFTVFFFRRWPSGPRVMALPPRLSS